MTDTRTIDARNELNHRIMAENCESAAEAEERCRAALLTSGDCFRTRKEAVSAVEKMLAIRAKS